MTGQERRKLIIDILKKSQTPVPGTAISKELKVSRQVIVQDIALLRANGEEILSTNQGYLLSAKNIASRVFKVIHTDEQVRTELQLIVDCGGIVKDVFVYHKVYGVVKADMNIRSRMDVAHFTQDIASGKSSLLKNITSGYHYHTVLAPSEDILNIIQDELNKAGFLAKLQEHEPVDFWNNI